jgi:hypothetical protein
MNTVLSYEIINGIRYPLRIPIEKIGSNITIYSLHNAFNTN